MQNSASSDFKLPRVSRREAYKKRNRAILRDYNAGMTGKELSVKYGLKIRRIWQVLAMFPTKPEGK